MSEVVAMFIAINSPSDSLPLLSAIDALLRVEVGCHGHKSSRRVCRSPDGLSYRLSLGAFRRR